MEIEKLTLFNDWWITKKVKESLLKPYKRPLFNEILRYLDDRQILLVTGLRRVGKTTLFYQLIQELLNKGVEPTKILYFSFDEESANIDDLLKTYREKVLKAEFENTKIYIFLDEIQKTKDWQNKLKIYYDIYPELKFFISGSASVSLQKKAKESLAGRIYDFILLPLSFDEFLDLRGVKVELEKIELYRDKILPHFFDYLRKGGFPEITHEEDDEKIRSYIKNSVIERIIYRDLPVEFGLKDIELLNILIRMIAENPGMILNYDNLSRDLKRSKTTIINYISYLEYAMILKLVYNYRKGFVTSSRKMRKIYLTNVSISFALVPGFYTEKFLEKAVENLVINKLNAKNYYRNNYEIDAVIKTSKGILPVEVKYGKTETKKILKFLEDFNLKEALVVTKDLFKKETIDGKKILFIPAWILLITPAEKYVGKITEI